MKTYGILLFLFFGGSTYSQLQYLSSDKRTVIGFFNFIDDYLYDHVFWGKSLPGDSIYLPRHLEFKKDCHIFFDTDKKHLATEIHFDTLERKIITKYYTRKGNIYKEQKFYFPYYTKDYNPDPFKWSPHFIEYI